MLCRKGTKGNPFKAGDTVKVRRNGRKVIVMAVLVPERNSPEKGERSYAPIRYECQLPHGTILTFSARDLEAIEPS